MQTCRVTKFKDQALGVLEQIAETGEPVIVTNCAQCPPKYSTFYMRNMESQD